MFYAGVILILAVVVTVFLVAWYFRSRHQVDLRRGSFMRVPSPSAHFVSFSLKKKLIQLCGHFFYSLSFLEV